MLVFICAICVVYVRSVNELQRCVDQQLTPLGEITPYIHTPQTPRGSFLVVLGSSQTSRFRSRGGDVEGGWRGIPWVGVAAGIVDISFFLLWISWHVFCADKWLLGCAMFWWSGYQQALRPLFTHICLHGDSHIYTLAQPYPFSLYYFSITHTWLPLSAWTWKQCVDLVCIIIVR